MTIRNHCRCTSGFRPLALVIIPVKAPRKASSHAQSLCKLCREDDVENLPRSAEDRLTRKVRCDMSSYKFTCFRDSSARIPPTLGHRPRAPVCRHMNMALPVLKASHALRRLCKRCRLTAVAERSNSSARSYATPAATRSASPLKLAIIGAGPSGFYTASRVLASLPADSEEGRNVEVHMYERLPTPYGLVRYGVAPDHPEVKVCLLHIRTASLCDIRVKVSHAAAGTAEQQNCQHKFDDLAKDPRFRYFGNVLVTSQSSIPSSPPSGLSALESHTKGSTSNDPQPLTALSPYSYPHALRLPLSSLTSHYNALLLSYGASLSNPLTSVPGSSSSTSPLGNVHPALAMVGWYNGHPAFADLPIDLRGISEVAVIGQGNVALDVARILLKSVDSLRKTDVPEHVLQTLSESSVGKVTAVGRRGPGQVAFTTKELREMTQIPDLGFRGIDTILYEQAKQMVSGDRMRTRLLGLMDKMAGQTGLKEFALDFLKSPKAFISGENGKVAAVEYAHNELVVGPKGKGASAAETSERSTSQADMVIESVGYRSEPLGPVGGEVWTLPFDERRGRVSNVGGRVADQAGATVSLSYSPACRRVVPCTDRLRYPAYTQQVGSHAAPLASSLARCRTHIPSATSSSLTA